MTIYERIQQDHDEHRRMMRELAETTGDSEQRRRLFAEFKREAESHADAEEQTFYAELMSRPESQEQARHSVTEHKETDDLLAKLADTEMDQSNWLTTFKQLREELEHHMQEEEDEVFALARKLLDDAAATSLAERFEQRKTQEKAADA